MKVQPIFSEQDNDLVDDPRWYSSGATRYAKRTIYHKTASHRQKKEYAHRIVAQRILGRELTRTEVVDHVNGCELDNTRQNIRVTNWIGNAQNRRGQRSSRGVTFHKKAGKWQAGVRHKGKFIYIGLFSSLLQATIMAKKKRRELGYIA